MTAEEWNDRYPIGTPVRYREVLTDSWPSEESKTRSEAWALHGGHSLVKIDGRSGGVSLAHLEVVETDGIDIGGAPETGISPYVLSIREHIAAGWEWESLPIDDQSALAVLYALEHDIGPGDFVPIGQDRCLYELLTVQHVTLQAAGRLMRDWLISHCQPAIVERWAEEVARDA